MSPENPHPVQPDEPAENPIQQPQPERRDGGFFPDIERNPLLQPQRIRKTHNPTDDSL